jgi:hypothetical protein
MTAKKVKLKMNAWKIVTIAVEQGVAYGYRRAHKHTDKPTEEHLVQEIEDAVMSAISDVVNWED